MEPGKDIPKLLALAREGEGESFEILVRRARGSLEAFVRSELRSRSGRKMDSMDIIQGALLRAFRSIRNFRGTSEDAFRGWLIQIARNELRFQERRIRARKRAPEAAAVSLDQSRKWNGGEIAALAAALVSRDESPSKILGQNERFDRLKSALATLSADHQQVILLARVRGMPMKDVAGSMGRTPRAASVLLLRALRKLRDAFGSTENLCLPARSLDEEKEDHGA